MISVEFKSVGAGTCHDRIARIGTFCHCGMLVELISTPCSRWIGA